jgi:hypothetical protein
MDVLKWIKSMPGVVVNASRAGLSSSVSVTKLKRQGASKCKLKENHSMMNSTQSMSRFKISH